MNKTRVLSLLLCLALALAAVGCDGGTTAALSSLAPSSTGENVSSEAEVVLGPYDHRILRVVEEEGNWRITGRTMHVIDDFAKDAMAFDHAAQGFFFDADCEGTVTLHLSIATDMHFLVRVDGQGRDVELANNVADPCLVLAEGLTRGKHSFEVYRCNELQSGVASVNAIELDGTLLPYEAPKKDLTMIVLGDSITAGEGILSRPGMKRTRMHSDATATYAFLTAQALNADFYILAQSGMNTNDKSTDGASYTHLYDKISWKRDALALYDNTKDDVDLFVISLGTNGGKFTDEELTAQIQALIDRVRADHPRAKIVWCYGQLTLGRSATVRAAVEEKMATDDKLYYYQFTTPNSGTANGHPTDEANAIDAQELTDFIRSNVL